ncbi:MAG: fibronectin type III domain-containing protein [Thermoplasmata archaeon]|nr:fibronectin type III domain-containing protein [Thermoplasmata archaeon]MCK5414197.1 fibronectin type III domain-containing protein [Thermoplasmata archaeon]
MGSAGGTEDFTLTTGLSHDGGVMLTWTVSEDPALHHYNIYWDTEKYDSVAGKSPKAAELGNTYLPQDLDNGVKYYFAVAPVDVNGTVLAEDFAHKTPRVGELDQVNFTRLMAVFFLVLIIYIFVIIKIPSWTKDKKGGM